MPRRGRIVGTGGYQPGEAITNEQIAALVGPLLAEVAEGISIQRCFWQIEPTGRLGLEHQGLGDTVPTFRPAEFPQLA